MSIADNISSVKAEIEKAAKLCGRDVTEIKLVAVTKTKPVQMLKEACLCNVTDFGENKPQEIVAKYPEVENENITWHLIGNLQKNKVRHIIDKVSLIHSVDSYELAVEINKRAAAICKVQDILIQVNISGEESKSGISPVDAEKLCRQISELENVRIKGLMTISVKGNDYEGNFKIFSRLKELSLKIKELAINNVYMDELSMGMTHDFQEAIAAGATIVRVGTAIFGERDYNNVN